MTTEATREGLQQRIALAFASVPKPPLDRIAPHQCEECHEIRNDLGQLDVNQVSVQTLENHYGALPLLTPEALRYFLSAYLFHTIENPESKVFHSVVMHLAPANHQLTEPYWQERLNVFSKEEREAVLAFLHWALTADEGNYSDEIKQGVSVWSRTA